MRRFASTLPRPASLSSGRVRQVEVPPAVRARTTLDRVDYADAFVLETGSAQDRTAGEWARQVMESAPLPFQHTFLLVFSALGLQFGPPRADGFIVGWEVRRNTPELALLGASGPRIGLSAELFFERQERSLLWATFVQQNKRIARAVWWGLAPIHRQVVSGLLEGAASGEPGAAG